MPVLSYRDLDSVIRPGTTIDILKIDGRRFGVPDLWENAFQHLLLSANILLVEVHGAVEAPVTL